MENGTTENKSTFLDLFSGIGGLRLGMEQAGYRCVGYCEIDGHARKSYQSIFDTKQEVEMHDITKISERGATFETITRTLDELGYDVKWQLFNSKEFVAQNRERVFIVGHLRGAGTKKIFPLTREEGSTDQKSGRIHLAGSTKAANGLSHFTLERKVSRDGLIGILTVTFVGKNSFRCDSSLKNGYFRHLNSQYS